MEVSGPRFDQAIAVQVVQSENDGSVAARGDADDPACSPCAESSVPARDCCRQLACERPRPVATRAEIEVFVVAFAGPGALWEDDQGPGAEPVEDRGEEQE